MFHRQMFEELRRTSHLTRDPTESVAIGAVEASFKCCASAIIVLTKSGRWDPYSVFPSPLTPGPKPSHANPATFHQGQSNMYTQPFSWEGGGGADIGEV